MRVLQEEARSEASGLVSISRCSSSPTAESIRRFAAPVITSPPHAIAQNQTRLGETSVAHQSPPSNIPALDVAAAMVSFPHSSMPTIDPQLYSIDNTVSFSGATAQTHADDTIGVSPSTASHRGITESRRQPGGAIADYLDPGDAETPNTIGPSTGGTFAAFSTSASQTQTQPIAHSIEDPGEWASPRQRPRLVLLLPLML
jgi:hypothetical protein